MNIIGISAFYHDSAACILQDGVLVAAAQEERFSRMKNDPRFPDHAIAFCLKQAGISIRDVDIVAYYEDPILKLSRQLWSDVDMAINTSDPRFDPHRAQKAIRENMGFEGTIDFHKHHLSHAASSYLYSGFQSSSILTVDGVGEWNTTTYGIGSNAQIKIFEEVDFPDSIGLLYSTITAFLGFAINSDEYKVMGLAPYGNPVYLSSLQQLINSGSKGRYSLDMKYFSFGRSNKMFTTELTDVLKIQPRVPGSEILQCHKDLAKSLQVLLELILLEKVKYLHDITGEDNLCLAGGVALNCVANGKIRTSGIFEDIFIQPSAGDSGCSLGAAAISYANRTGKFPNSGKPLRNVLLGPEYSDVEITKLLEATDFKYIDYQIDIETLMKEVTSRLSEGKVVGWFQGASEFGPRALGSRSILADPRVENMRDKINAMVKKREGFRPFAPAILSRFKNEHFDMEEESPFMLETCQVISPLSLPAITHVDGSARVQTVNHYSNQRFELLLECFMKETGCPILLNTSFNVKDEPIVNSPVDALESFISTQIDCLVVGSCLIDRNENMELINWLGQHQQAIRRKKNTRIAADVYTFI